MHAYRTLLSKEAGEEKSPKSAKARFATLIHPWPNISELMSLSNDEKEDQEEDDGASKVSSKMMVMAVQAGEAKKYENKYGFSGARVQHGGGGGSASGAVGQPYDISTPSLWDLEAQYVANKASPDLATLSPPQRHESKAATKNSNSDWHNSSARKQLSIISERSDERDGSVLVGNASGYEVVEADGIDVAREPSDESESESERGNERGNESGSERESGSESESESERERDDDDDDDGDSQRDGSGSCFATPKMKVWQFDPSTPSTPIFDSPNVQQIYNQKQGVPLGSRRSPREVEFVHAPPNAVPATMDSPWSLNEEKEALLDTPHTTDQEHDNDNDHDTDQVNDNNNNDIRRESIHETSDRPGSFIFGGDDLYFDYTQYFPILENEFDADASSDIVHESALSAGAILSENVKYEKTNHNLRRKHLSEPRFEHLVTKLADKAENTFQPNESNINHHNHNHQHQHQHHHSHQDLIEQSATNKDRKRHIELTYTNPFKTSSSSHTAKDKRSLSLKKSKKGTSRSKPRDSVKYQTSPEVSREVSKSDRSRNRQSHTTGILRTSSESASRSSGTTRGLKLSRSLDKVSSFFKSLQPAERRKRGATGSSDAQLVVEDWETFRSKFPSLDPSLIPNAPPKNEGFEIIGDKGAKLRWNDREKHWDFMHSESPRGTVEKFEIYIDQIL
ncbi:uncharacterized protein LODBEIA_P06980 [Lodderomyces beijingensis]|uniref:AGC-kinase C-terminal domain-containing protein n=1 Tax=Lodderomyces beijingensis TaxID=1775926 RepID=A0ABP0ZE98_9ASCO